MSAVLLPTRIASPWRPILAALAVVLAAVLLAFAPTFAAMVEIWSRSETFTHGFLVPPLSLWMIWRQRARLALMAPQPQPWLALALLPLGAAWLVGALGSVNALTQAAATAMLVVAVCTVVGLRVAREITFPLAFLFFMVPFGEFLLPVLMEGTADFTVMALRLSGVPVYREGLQFIIPTGNWSVVEACSGVRYLIASFMVGSLFAYLNYRSTRRRVLFGLVSLVVPVVANWLRAYMIVMLGHLSSNKIATGVDHLIYGWVFFGVVILLMFFIGARWSEPDAPAPAAGTPAAAATAGPGLTWGVVAMLLALLAAPPWALDRMDRQVGTATPALALPAALAGGWVRDADATLPLTPSYVGAAAQDGATYRKGDLAVYLHVAYYRHQGPGRKLSSSENVLVKSNDREWNQLRLGSRESDVGGRLLKQRQAEIAHGSPGQSSETNRLDVRQWFWVAGRWVGSFQEAAAWGVLGRLAGEGDDAAAVVVYVTQPADGSGAATLDDFIRLQLPTFEALLVATRQGAQQPSQGSPK